MKIEYYTDAARFAQETQAFLLQHETENCFTLGFVIGLAANAFTLTTPPLLALAREGQEVVGVAMQTPPRNLVLTVMERAVVEQFARDLFVDGRQLPGVFGPLQSVEVFAAAWCAASGTQATVSLRERVFELKRVIPPRPTSGHFRWSTPADRETLIVWRMAFEREALQIAEPNRAEHEAIVDRGLQHSEWRGMSIWEDAGQPVSLAAFGAPTPHGIRIAPVYTPPELRGRGYASACVAALSQHLLDSGRQRCYLYTDLANPTANKIYQAIGYRPVADALEMRFGPP